MQLVPYLGFNGQCEAAFKFYERCLGGKIVTMMTYGETPAAGHTSPELKDRIMHARLLAGEAELMGGDTPQEQFEAPRGFCVSIQIDDPARAERIFNDYLRAVPQIIAADTVAGETDYVITAVARDVAELQEVLAGLATRGGQRLVTYLRLAEVKTPSRLPLAATIPAPDEPSRRRRRPAARGPSATQRIV